MMFNHSEQINEIAAALAKAQAVMGGAKKTSNNPYFQSKYADLAECLNTARKPLSDNGISVSQCVGEIFESVRYEPLTQKVKGVQEYVFDKDGRTVMIPILDMKIEVTTVLMHSSGQWIASTGKYIIGKQDIQGEGGAVTYARRYGLAAMIGLAQEDDDGNSNVKPPKKNCVTFEDGVAIVHAGGKEMPVPMMNEEQLKWTLRQPWATEAHKSAREILLAMDLGEETMKNIDKALDE